MRNYIAVLAMVLMSGGAYAKTHEITQMKEILPYVDKDTLVVFDIDNTLAESSETIGSVQWQENEIARAAEDGLPEDKRRDRSIRRFAAVAFVGQMRPVEKTTPEVVRQIQKTGAKVMALTARPSEIHARTNYLLNEMGIQLDKSAPLEKELRTYHKEPIQYHAGIVAVGAENDKGESLKWLISQTGFSPFKRIVFVDDKSKYVESLEKAFANSGTDIQTFRYGAADARVKAFNPNLARVQTDYFLKYGKILSDKEAAKKAAPVQSVQR